MKIIRRYLNCSKCNIQASAFHESKIIQFARRITEIEQMRQAMVFGSIYTWEKPNTKMELWYGQEGYALVRASGKKRHRH